MTPKGFIRRALGVNPITTGTLRSRSGNLEIFDLNELGETPETGDWSKGVYRFEDYWLVANPTTLREFPFADPDDADVVYFGLSGSKLTFVRMPILVTEDHLFFTNQGGTPYKRNAAGTLTRWGIPEPSADFEISQAFPKTTSIDRMLDGIEVWTNDGATSIQYETAVTKDVRSLRITTAANTTSSVSRRYNPPKNLMRFEAPTALSSIHDYITFWLRAANVASLDFLQIDFALALTAGNTPDFNNTASFILLPERPLPPGDPDTPIPATNTDPTVTGSQTIKIQERTWIRIQIPKSAFSFNAPPDDAIDWHTVHGIRFTTNSLSKNLFLYIDSVFLSGGSPMQGKYVYRTTYKNSSTGSRSNPNPNEITTPASFGEPLVPSFFEAKAETQRNAITLRNFGPAPDPQCDKIEIWRTVGNGAEFFLNTTLDVGTSSYTDEIADYEELGRYHVMPADGTISASGVSATVSDATMHSLINEGAQIFVNDETRSVTVKGTFPNLTLDRDAGWTTAAYKIQNAVPTLEPESLEFDNDPPENTYGDAVGPHLGRMWWCRDSAAAGAHRIYYSPSGRPEAVQGFISATHTSDATQKLVQWNGSLWCFTIGSVFQVLGDTEPFTVRRIGQCPGTIRPFTVVPTPLGIFYQSYDGIRLFNGQDSILAGYEALAPLFRGEAAEGLAAFEGQVAVFARNEYWVSDGTTTLCLNTTTGQWREHGIPFYSLFYDEERDELIGVTTGNELVKVENEGTLTDPNGPIPFAVETGPGLLDTQDAVGLVTRVFVEVELNGQTLSPTLILDSGEVVELPDLWSAEPTGLQQFEMAILKKARIVGVRLATLLTDKIEITRVEAEFNAKGR